ncbi:MAG: class I SAM-dependent methyltransferase [Thermoleophilaceae bacterium]
MTTETIPTATADALMERVFGASIAAMDLATIHIGRELGLYQTLRDAGALSSATLAAMTGTDERYVREWLEHQAVSEILEAEEGAVDPERRRFSLPAGHAEALLDHTSPSSVGPLAQFVVGEIVPIEQLIAAFRSGEGVPYDAYPICREGQAEVNRPLFVHELASWIEALGEQHEAFSARGGRVADVACGSGWSSIELARAYPRVHVDGYDLDAPSIAMANDNLAGSGLADRVRFLAADAADAAPGVRYDLVTIFEAVHDLARPVEVLESARRMLAPGGVVLVADEKVAHEFEAPGDDVERLMYGYSVLFCLPTSREEQPSAATGTAMRPHTMEGYAEAAGFSRTDVLDIDNDIWRFYRLVP